MIWMRAYGKECMKKSCIWSNSRLVSKLHVQDVSKALSALLAVVLCLCFWQMYSVLQTLFAMQELRAKAKPLCKTYVDANGKKRYSGIPKKMKSSQLGPCVLVSAGIYVIYVYMHSLIQVVSGLRSYTCAFGYRIAELLPQLPEGVWGFKNPAKDCLANCTRLLVCQMRGLAANLYASLSLPGAGDHSRGHVAKLVSRYRYVGRSPHGGSLSLSTWEHKAGSPCLLPSRI